MTQGRDQEITGCVSGQRHFHFRDTGEEVL